MRSFSGKNNRYISLFSDICIFLIGNVLAKAIQFLLMPLYTTYMSTETYGVAELTNNLSELLFPIATLCIYEAAFRFAVDPDFDNRRLATATVKVMRNSVIVGLAVTFVVRYVFHYKYAFYLYFILYAYSFRMCVAYYMKGCGESVIFAMSGVVNALTLSLCNLIFLVWLRLEELGYLISIGLSYCCSTLYLLSRGGVHRNIDLKIDSRRDLSILLKYCTPLIFYNILYWLTTISGRYVLLWFSDSSTVGKYVAATKIASVINMIQQAIFAAFQLNSSRAYAEVDKERYYSELTNLLISCYCIFGSIAVCMTPILARFTLKNDFFDASVYLPVIMLAALFNCISSVLGTMYSTYKRTKRMVGVSVVGAGINIMVGIMLAPSIGVWGVCIASVLCFFSQIIYKFIDVRKFCRINYNWRVIVPNIALLTIQVVIMSSDSAFCSIVSIIIPVLLAMINLPSLISAAKNFLKNT